MKLRDSLKGFKDAAVGKVIAPSQTCEIVLKKLQKIIPPIYQQHTFIERPTGIPQYRVTGTEYYQQIVDTTGQNGKGHTKEQALASGLMEMAERYSCYIHLQKKSRIFSWRELPGNPFSINDFYAQFLDEAQARILKDEDVYSAKIRWVEGSDLEGRKVYLPMGLINLILQGSNGMGAGNAREEALLHALCEVIERHCLTLVKRQGLETPLIDQATIRSPIARELLKKCKVIDKDLLIKDFSLGFGLPVLAVITRVRRNECLISVGVATHREEALIRALTENSQTAGIGKQLDGVSEVKHCFKSSKTLSFEEIPCIDHDNMRLEIEAIQRALTREGMKAFFVDTTEEVLDIPSVYVYVSGAKYYEKNTARRNILTALINESFTIGNLGSAGKYIEKGIARKDQDRSEYLFYKGALLSKKSQYKKAIPYLLRALRLSDSSEGHILDALASLGICYEAGGDMGLALRAYTKLLDLSYGEGIKALEKSSRVLISLPPNKFFAAKSLYEDVKTARWRCPGMKQASFLKGFCAYQKKSKALARLLREMLAHFEGRQYVPAIGKAKKAMVLHGFAEKIYGLNSFLAFCYLKLEAYPQAVQALRRAGRTDPENEKINFNLARCYKVLGQTKKHQKELDKAMRKLSTAYSMKIDLLVKPQGYLGWLKKVW